MSEIEFERIMDAVQKAVMLVPVQEALAGFSTFEERPKAANDNFNHLWPIIPFPEGIEGALRPSRRRARHQRICLCIP